ETRADIISRMTNAQKQVLDKLWPTRAENLPFKTREEALILASIIEKETGIGGERARIAGVFVNRLRIGMPLQTDPTVIYALTMGKHQNDGQGPLGRRLLSKDLKVDSPYNTYRYKGLPPTPIANAGRAAIAAALNPETHKYLYFVADGTGGHAFSKTLAEHNANAAKWRKIRKAQGN
ncbi:MAG: endolytic transglycosylase MltG, partial [Pseudomonadota bacterium]|nr:endolytic transglycosylase MltG [Pseudomonadota bacterium]